LGTEVSKKCPVQDDLVGKHDFRIGGNAEAFPGLQSPSIKDGSVGRMQVFEPDRAIVE
jgi:hypothetical protein